MNGVMMDEAFADCNHNIDQMGTLDVGHYLWNGELKTAGFS